ncbi:MAG: hypothetical protein ACPGXK_01865 [Phycisphaerae bacterium]
MILVQISPRLLYASSLITLAIGFVLLATLMSKRLFISEAKRLPAQLQSQITWKALTYSIGTRYQLVILLVMTGWVCRQIGMSTLHVLIIDLYAVLLFMWWKARPAVRQWVFEQLNVLDETLCTRCGYNLRGMTKGQAMDGQAWDGQAMCPECGVTVTVACDQRPGASDSSD